MEQKITDKIYLMTNFSNCYSWKLMKTKINYKFPNQ